MKPLRLTTNTNVIEFYLIIFSILVHLFFIQLNVAGGIIDYMIASGSSILSWIALRILTKGKMEDFLEAREELEKDGDGGRLLASTRNPDSYSGIYHLATLSHLRSDKDFFDRTFMALFLFQCLRASGYLQTRFRYEEDSLNITEDEIYFASLLLRHLQLLQFNAHEIHEFV